jgi:pyruvate/2-oxoglutarate dehydrogenase complex dihydrolipoamide dehydrogenase (E3) component
MLIWPGRKLLTDERGLLKLLIDPITFRLQGVHIVGMRAAELVHIGEVLMAAGARPFSFAA